MSVRPVDMQITIQKSDQYIKEFNINTKTTLEQQDLTNELQKKMTKDLKQVVSSQGSRYKRINREQHEKSDSNRKQGKKKKDSKPGGQERVLSNDNKGISIDIIV